jgi:hypothetical protein
MERFGERLEDQLWELPGQQLLAAEVEALSWRAGDLPPAWRDPGAAARPSVDIDMFSILSHTRSRILRGICNYASICQHMVALGDREAANVMWLHPMSSSTTLLHWKHRCQ